VPGVHEVGGLAVVEADFEDVEVDVPAAGDGGEVAGQDAGVGEREKSVGGAGGARR